MELQDVQNCGDELQIIKNLNSSLKLTDDCGNGMSSSSCSMLRPYNKTELFAQVFEVRSGILVFETKLDLCDKKKKSDMVKLGLLGFGVPMQCSSKKTTETVFCNNPSKPLQITPSLQKLLSIFAANGQVKLVAKMNHDTGTSCMISHMTFIKK